MSTIPTLFDHLNNITALKTPWSDDPSFKKNYSQYMINRFVFMQEMFMPLIEEINRLGPIPDQTHYEFLSKFLPKKKVYFKYIKKINGKEYDDETIRALQEYFEITRTEAEDYFQLIPNNILKELKQRYTDNSGIISKN